MKATPGNLFCPLASRWQRFWARTMPSLLLRKTHRIHEGGQAAGKTEFTTVP